MKLPDRPVLIAVTGGIASGKSLTCEWFRKKGVSVIYADNIAHEILLEPSIKAELSKQFGSKIETNGSLNRKKLGNLVFNDPESLQFLNELIHPEVLQEMDRIIHSSDLELLIFEIPLLFEKGLQKAFDFVINLYTIEGLQVSRLVNNRKMSRQKAEQIIRVQFPAEIKKSEADLTIENNGEVSELYNQLEIFWDNIGSLQHKNVLPLEQITGN